MSGGQTGVDRAALDAAILLDIEYGGWCPKGRLDEHGTIPTKYKNLEEIAGEFKTEKENYDARTRANIKGSKGTLIIVPKLSFPEKIKDGTKLTIEEAQRLKKPNLIVNLSNPIHVNAQLIVDWIEKNEISILNIGGPRESTCPGIYQASFKLLEAALFQCVNSLKIGPFNVVAKL